jgi:hypothetical protein
MDVGQARTRFFKRNSEKADELTLHPHKEKEFWLWVASWALFLIGRPTSAEFSDDGYILPELDIRWHEVPTDHSKAAGPSQRAGGAAQECRAWRQGASREKRDSIPARIAKMMAISRRAAKRAPADLARPQRRARRDQEGRRRMSRSSPAPWIWIGANKR